MTARKNTEEHNNQASTVRPCYFPTLGVSVEAATEDEALALAEQQLEAEAEREEGDD